MSGQEISTNKSKASFEDLKVLLKEEIALYEQLIDLLKKKQWAIVENNLEELRFCIQEEQPIIQHTKDNARLLESLLAAIAPSGKKCRLKDVISLAPGSIRTSLERGRQRLIASLDEISRINQENRYLLNFSLEFTKGMIRLLLSSDDENEKIYNLRGHVTNTEKNNKILNVQI